MDTYTFLREIAGSWVLIGLFSFYFAAVLWAFRPGGGRVYKDTADIPFRNDDKPAQDADAPDEESH